MSLHETQGFMHPATQTSQPDHTQECKDVQAKWFSDHFNKPRALIWLCNCWCHGETE